MRRAGVVGRLLAVFVLVASLGPHEAPAQPRPVKPDSEGGTYKRYAEGLFARRVFSTPSPNRDYVVEVWRFSVPPATRSETVVLPGAAAMVVRLGRVIVVTGEKRQALTLGGSMLLPEGEKVSFVNEDRRRPVNLRVVILRGEGSS